MTRAHLLDAPLRGGMSRVGPPSCHIPLRHSLRGKGKIINDTTISAPVGTTYTGDDVLDWLGTGDARRQADMLARRRGLTGYDAMTQNVLAEARIAVWHRMQSDSPLLVERPGGYGTTVIRSVLRQMAEGRDGPVRLVDDPDAIDRVPQPDGTDPAWAGLGPTADTSGDDVRVHLERLDDDRPWITSAALTYLTLLMEPTARPDDAPWPRSGSREDQARCWPGLWYAGERELFDDGVDAADRARIRRTRARRIKVVLDRIQRALALHALELRSDGSGGDYG
jgi:hypothetical protein